MGKEAKVHHYNGYRIYGIAVPAQKDGWHSRGIILAPNTTATIELKRLEGPADLTFRTKEEAEEHGLKLCREWIEGKRRQDKR